ncbi:MAG TPA: glycosyltransferase family 4 protein [Pyrinomonadaceae bacterium]|nr:glycosyltransferase family 4 protein [Pyrinomonadaceae bacterium]
MRILQISSAQTLGGGERHLVDLTHGLITKGHEVFVALRPQSALLNEFKDLPQHKIQTLNLRNAVDVNSAIALARLVKDKQIEIVHAHMGRDYPLAAYAVSRNASARLVLTRHVLFRLSRLHRITFAKAACVIAVSQAVAAQLRGERITAPEKIRVVLNGIDVKKFIEARDRGDREQFLNSLDLPQQCTLIGTVGELTPLKGHEEFLHAAAAISKTHPNCYFVLAGIDHSADGRNERQIEWLIDQLNLRERVRRVRWLENLAQLHSALDVFVSASRSESFGLAIVEAMASKTAVVATATLGACETVRPGETGLLTTIGDAQELAGAIARLLDDQPMRMRLAAAAQAEASEKFDVRRMVTETEEIYRSIAQRAN